VLVVVVVVMVVMVLLLLLGMREEAVMQSRTLIQTLGNATVLGREGGGLALGVDD
jgi:hypothetical protein